jgi:hypothetical protein
MGTWPAKVLEDRLLGAASLFLRLSQHSEAGWVELPARQESLVVSSLSERDESDRPHGRNYHDREEGVAEDAAE